MGLLDKFKNMFTEEVDDDELEDEVEKQDKKEKVEVKEKSYKPEKTYNFDIPEKKERTTRSSYVDQEDEFSIPSKTISNIKEEIVVKKYEPSEPIVKKEEKTVEVKKEEKVEIKREEKTPQRREDKFVFPVYFDDSDFEKIEKATAPKKEKKVVKEEKKEEPVKKEVYGSKIEKTEKKVFKPTPIISPIYGVIDKNYMQEYSSVKKPVHNEYRSSKPLSIDEVRKKAFGIDTVEDENLAKDSMMATESNENKKDALDDLDTKNNYNSIDEFLNSDPIEYKAKHGNSKTKRSFESDMDQIEKKLNDYSSKKNNLDDLFDDDNLLGDYMNSANENDNTNDSDDDLTQSDLFNLIDSMYDKGDEK